MLAFQINGQAQSYIETDSSKSTGGKILFSTERDNNAFIKLKLKTGTVTYTPEQLTGYGVIGKSSYVAKTILVNGTERKVFLNKRVNGTLSLYSYRSRDFDAFFLEAKDKNLIPLLDDGQEGYRTLLSSYLDSCAHAARNVKWVRYRPSSLTRLLTQFNSCSSKPFPRLKLGAVVGYGTSNVFMGPDYFGPISSYNWKTDYSSFVVGVTGDFPINSGYVSLHTDVLLSRSQFNTVSQSGAVVTDIVYNSSSIDVPVLVRYRLPTPGWRPFVNAGLQASFNLNTKGNIYTSTFDQDVVTTSTTEVKILPGLTWGVAAGLGIEYDLLSRNAVFVELRLARAYGGSDSLQKDQVLILTGFTF